MALDINAAECIFRKKKASMKYGNISLFNFKGLKNIRHVEIEKKYIIIFLNLIPCIKCINCFLFCCDIASLKDASISKDRKLREQVLI